MAFRKLSADELRAIRDREQAATLGPWRWRGNTTGHHLELRSLVGWKHRVMTFWRWGMQGAQPYFLSDDKGMVKPPKLVPSAPHNAWDIVAIDHPDARFIEHAREDIPRLLAHLEALEFEVGTLTGLLQCERGETVSIEELRAKYGTGQQGEVKDGGFTHRLV